MESIELVKNLTKVAAVYVAACMELKDDPVLQGSFLASALETLKRNDGLNPNVDYAISVYGKVLRAEEN